MATENQAGDIRNYMEDCVEDMLERMMKNTAFAKQTCTCEFCKLDIMAIALNTLPQKYVVTRKGELYAKINSLQNQFEVDIISAITKATSIVGRNPRHE